MDIYIDVRVELDNGFISSCEYIHDWELIIKWIISRVDFNSLFCFIYFIWSFFIVGCWKFFRQPSFAFVLIKGEISVVSWAVFLVNSAWRAGIRLRTVPRMLSDQIVWLSSSLIYVEFQHLSVSIIYFHYKIS